MYCKKCGKKCIEKVTKDESEKRWLGEYSFITGKKIDYSTIEYVCPDHKWYNAHTKKKKEKHLVDLL